MYHYAANNPVRYIDPDGKVTKHKDLKGKERIKEEAKDMFGCSFRIGLFASAKFSFFEILTASAEVDIASMELTQEGSKLTSEDSAGVSVGLGVLDVVSGGVEISKKTESKEEVEGYSDILENVWRNGETDVDVHAKVGDLINISTSSEDKDAKLGFEGGLGIGFGVWVNLSEVCDFFKTLFE